MTLRYVKTVVLSLTMGVTFIYGGGKEEMKAEPIPVEPIPPLYEPNPIYLGLGGVWGKYNGLCGSTPDCTYEDVTYGALVRAGYEINPYLGLEARMLATFLEADPLGGQELNHIGLFLKPMYPVTERFNVYALLGYGWTKTKTSSSYLNTVDEKGFSAGAGVEFDLSNKNKDYEKDTKYDRGFDGYADQERGFGLFVDYQRLLLNPETPSDPDIDVVSAGVTYDF